MPNIIGTPLSQDPILICFPALYQKSTNQRAPQLVCITVANLRSLLLLQGHLTNLLHPSSTVVERHQVPPVHVEPIEIVHRLFCIEYVLVNHKSRPLTIPRVALSYLPDGTKSPKHVVHFLRGYLVGQVAHKYYLVDLRSQPHRPALASRARSSSSAHLYPLNYYNLRQPLSKGRRSIGIINHSKKQY